MVRQYEPGRENHEFNPRLGIFLFLSMEKEVKITNSWQIVWQTCYAIETVQVILTSAIVYLDM